MCPTMRILRFDAASSTRSSPCFTSMASGFSTKTSFPASIAALAIAWWVAAGVAKATAAIEGSDRRSEEHTSELQSPCNLVCRLLLEKKKKQKQLIITLADDNTPRRYI